MYQCAQIPTLSLESVQEAARGKETRVHRTGHSALEVSRKEAKDLTKGQATNETTKPFAGDHGDGVGE